MSRIDCKVYSTGVNRVLIEAKKGNEETAVLSVSFCNKNSHHSLIVDSVNCVLRACASASMLMLTS